MRITLNLDDDVHLAVKEAAQRRGTTMGRVLSELVRDSLTRGGTVPTKDDFQIFPDRPGGSPASLELVNRLRDEEP